MNLFTYTVQKIPLSKFVKHPITQCQIFDTCKELNKIVIHVYQLLRLKLLYHFKLGNFPCLNETDIKIAFKVFFPNGKGRPFNDLLLLEEYQTFYDQIYQPLTNCSLSKITGASYIIDSLAADIFTNIENNVKMHFKSHLKTFLNALHNPTYDKTLKKELSIVRDDILLKNTVFKSPEKYHATIGLLSAMLPDTELEDNHYLGCLKNPLKYLEMMFFMAEIVESREQKTLQVFPLRKSLIPANIPIDTSSLITLFFKDHKPSELLKKVREVKNNIWRKLFHMNHRVFKNKKFVFDYRILTDGHSVSLQFIERGDASRKESKKDRMHKRPNMINEEVKDSVVLNRRKMRNGDWKYIGSLSQEELEKLQKEGFLVADPGKNHLLFLMDSMSGETIKFTSKKKRHECQENNFKIKRKKIRYKTGVLEIEKKLLEVSGKCCNIRGFENYIRVKESVSNEVRVVYEAKIFRKLRWYTHVERLKYFSKVAKKIESSGKKTIVYGDWSAGNNLRGSRPTIGIGLKRQLAKKFEIINLDEYRTSKLDFKNHEVCKNLQVGGKSVHSMLTYRTENNCTGNIGRDLNAVRNMLYIALEVIRTGERPLAFRRNRNAEGLSELVVSSESGPVHDDGDIVLE